MRLLRSFNKDMKFIIVFRTLSKIVPVIVKHKPKQLGILLGLRLTQAVIPALQIYITSKLVDSVWKLVNESNFQESVIFLTVQLILFFLASWLKYWDELLVFRARLQLKFIFESMLAEKSSRLDLNFFDQSNSYDLMQRAHSGQFGFDFIVSILSIFQNTLTLISLLIVLININILFFIVMLMFIFPAFLINTHVSKLKFDQSFSLTPLNRKISYLYSLVTTRQPAKEIRLFKLKNEIVTRWKQLYDRNASEQIQLYSRTRKLLFLFDTIIIILSSGLIAFALLLSIKGRLSVGQFVALIQTTLQSKTIIQGLSNEVSRIYETSLQSSQYFDFLALPEEDLNESGFEFPTLHKGISIVGLSMKYPGKEHYAIRNITFTINKGEKIAIVGENGAGKTTLTKCLLGLYTEYTGRITFDDIDLSKIMKKSMRSKITALFQDYSKFELSVKDNIAFGDIEHVNDMAAIQHAAEKGGVTDFLDLLKNNYDTLLGPSFSGGQELSIGQWQKVALSRALMKDAQVVVLDEPTSSLDPVSEANLVENFIEITKDKTAIIISHRLGICKYVDRIIVLKNGQLIESGTHVDLLKKNGLYAEMYGTQSKWYA